MERRLAAILFTDVVGYTALMARDEAAGRRVRARHEALVREQVTRYHGQWIEEKGDESLSVFPSALQAVNCALAIQAELSGDPELQLRIGIHLGDVTIEDGRVYGDGVNVAARVRPLAEPGGIAVSDPVYDSIKNQPGIEATSKGLQTLKNVAAAVSVWSLAGAPGAPGASARIPLATRRSTRVTFAALAIALALVSVWRVFWNGGSPAGAATSIRSLAVLPLDDPSAGADEAYFSFGMTETLIKELAKLEGLRVVSRNSVEPFEKSALSIGELAEQLGVDGIIEGSVLRSGSRVRITAQLIDARSDSHLWAESYDRDLGDVLPLQAEVAREIARQVKLTVLPPDDRPVSSRSMAPPAYEAYLKGQYFVMKRTREDTMRALGYFHEVIRLEPDHPLGYSALADEYSCVPTHSWRIAESALWPSVPSEMIAQARENARKALDLDPLSGPAHNSIALVSTFGDWNFAAAEASFRRALELSPGNAWSHFGFALLLAFERRFADAQEHLELARELDPLRVDYTMGLAALHLWKGDREQAYHWWKQAEEIDPSYPGLHQGVIIGFCGTERHGEALAALENANRKFPDDPLVLAETAYCHALGGNALRAREILARVEALASEEYVSQVARAMVHVGLGERDLALEALEQGIRNRDFLVPYLSVEPTWDPLRDDLRFVELLERIGLPSG